MDNSKNILIFRGNEIKTASLKKEIRKIDKNRMRVGNNIAYIEDKDFKNSNYTESDYCILGTDWYMYLSIQEDTIIIESLQSSNSKNAMSHALEMMRFFKDLFLSYPHHTYKASLNRTSLRLYTNAVKRGIIEEISRLGLRYDMYITCTFKITQKFLSKYDTNKSLKMTPIRDLQEKKVN